MATKRSTGKSKNLDPRRIERNPEYPRLIFRQDEMDNLMFSIDRHGIQVPLTVYEDGHVYRLIDGERRWRCATKLNLRSVPVLVQDKTTELENLLLMYNIHALREQWDYFTIASKLTRVMELYKEENGREPNEIELSDETGLTRGQIQRCSSSSTSSISRTTTQSANTVLAAAVIASPPPLRLRSLKRLLRPNIAQLNRESIV